MIIDTGKVMLEAELPSTAGAAGSDGFWVAGGGLTTFVFPPLPLPLLMVKREE